MKEIETDNQNTETPKAERDPSPASDADTIVALAASLGRVSKCLIMCAPKFAEGSEGAVAVELARRSIPVVNGIIQSRRDIERKQEHES